MASLEEKLCCAICMLLYQDPVTLPCGHSFCGACIQRWRRQCPNCRKPFPDDAELHRNVLLSELAEMVRAQQGCRAGDPGPAPAAEARCPRHGRPLELYCRSEGRCVCSACTVGECRDHQRALLDTVRREREAQLRVRLEAQPQQLSGAEQQLRELRQQVQHVQSSACTLASVVSSKFSCLLQALEARQAQALLDVEAAKSRALEQARVEEQRLQRHMQALTEYGSRARNLLEERDHRAFLQGLQHLVPPEPAEPLTPVKWDEEQQLGLKKWLSQLAGLLEEEGCLRAPVDAAGLQPRDAPGPPTRAPSMLCPRMKSLRQNYRNLTFDPSSANRHLHVSRRDQRVEHRLRARDPGAHGSFELWQVQCRQSFASGHHYWEVRTSGHSVTLGVAYRDLPRCRVGNATDNIGRGPSSWGLCIQEDAAQAWHDGKAQRLPAVSGRLFGVDLDLPAGRLCFYSLEPETRCLHTFHTVFTQPLYPVFWLLEGRKLTLLHQPEATHSQEHQPSRTPERQATPTRELETTPTPESQTTPTPERQTTPTPESQTTPTPESQTMPIPEPQALPTPERQTTPTPESQTTPIPEPQSTPTPEPQALPTPERQATPTRELQTTPTPESQTTPIPEPQALPTPERQTTPIPEPQTTPAPEPQATPTLQTTPTHELQALPTPERQATPTLELQTTPTQELQALLIPEPQALPTREPQATPTSEGQATPTVGFQTTPTQELQALPTLELQAAPIPEPQTLPILALQVTSTPELQATPTLELRATPTPELQALPRPELQELPLGDSGAVDPVSSRLEAGVLGPLTERLQSTPPRRTQ